MGRVNTNSVSLAYSIEPTLGTPGPLWTLIEPNTIGDFGAVVTTVSRSPISLNRQPRKGTVTDLDSSVGFDVDLTLSGFRDFVEGFAFSIGVNRDMMQIASTAASTTNDSYTVAALTAAQAGKLNSGTLIWSAGFTNSANNGLKFVDANIATSALSITVSENLVTQAGESGRLSLTGYRISAASSPTWAWNATGRLATLALNGLGTTLLALGLTPGQVVHLGSVASLGAPDNQRLRDSTCHPRLCQSSDNQYKFSRIRQDGYCATSQRVDSGNTCRYPVRGVRKERFNGSDRLH